MFIKGDVIMDKDEYNQIINGKRTYRVINANLRSGYPVIINWTDGLDTALTILFTPTPQQPDDTNFLGFGMRHWYVYVSIIGMGAFGFNSNSVKSPEYVAEKLNLTLGTYTAEKLTELLNGVILYGKEGSLI